MNDTVRRARETALDILKPSQRDLDHGLSLHAESLVAESYSLGLHAPMDVEKINALTEDGASNDEFQDAVEDGAMTGWAFSPELRREYLEAWDTAGISCMFLNAGEEGNDIPQMLKRLARYIYLTDAMPETLARAACPADIEANHRAGKRTIYLTLNGIPLPGKNRLPHDELLHLRVFAQLGVRMMHLTYNRRNAIGDGCGEPANAGLSDFGRMAVREMNRLGIMIDLAHTGWNTCLDAANASEKPVVVSHSAVHALNAHMRCKTDEVIRAVVDKGGTMGITTIPAFLGGSGDIAAFLDHIDYMVRHFGPDSVTIGTDTGHLAKDAAVRKASITPRAKRRARWESLWPKGDALFLEEWNTPRQKESLVWTNWPLFTVGLVQRGHSDETIRKIIGGNILRVAEEVWSGSHSSAGMQR